MPSKTKHSYLAWDAENPDAVEAWSTGNLFLDWQTGCNGIPKGRLVECSGPESSGKSTLGLQTAAAVWRTYGIPSTYYDFEDAFDARYAKALGLTAEGLLLEQPATLEEFFAMFDEDLKASVKGRPRSALSIVDSVAAARTEDDIKNAAVDNRTAGMNRARLWTHYLGANVHRMNETDMTLLLVNQQRDFIDTDTTFMPPGMKAMQPKTKTPGGRGIKFYSSLRIAFEQSSEIKVDTINPLTREPEKMVVGKNVWLKVIKNKVAPPPWRKVRLQIRDGVGFDLVENLVDFAETHDLLKRNKGVWTISPAVTGHQSELVVAAEAGVSGDDRVRWLFRTDSVLYNNLHAAVSYKLAEIEQQLLVSPADMLRAEARDDIDEEAMASAPDVPVLQAPNGSGGNASLST